MLVGPYPAFLIIQRPAFLLAIVAPILDSNPEDVRQISSNGDVSFDCLWCYFGGGGG